MKLSVIVIGLLVGFSLTGAVVWRHSYPAQPDLEANEISAELANELDQLRSEGIRLFQAGEIARSRDTFAQARHRAEKAGAVTESIRFALSDATIDLQLHRYRRAMRTYIEQRDRLRHSDDPELEAALLASMSWTYLMTDALDEAKVAIDQALALAPSPEENRHLPTMLIQRALLEVNDHDFASAARDCSRALRLADRQGDIALQADILDSYGWELLRRGHHEPAEPPLVEAFRLRRLHGIAATDQSYRNLATLRLAHGDLRSAEILINRAFEAARTAADPLPRWALHYHRALIRDAAGRHEEALGDLDLALAAADRLRLSLLPAESTRLSAGVGLRRLYDSYVDLAYRIWQSDRDPNLVARSFEIAERSRAAALREELGADMSFQEELPDEYWEVLRQVSSAENRVLRGEESESLVSLRHRLTELELEAGLGAGSETAPISFTAKDIQAALDSDTALFAFQLGDERSYRWALTRESMSLAALPGRRNIEARLRKFRRAVESDQEVRNLLGREIYQQLFGGIHHHVEWQSNWCLLLDGALFELPIAALVSGMRDTGPTYLVEDHSLRILPGAALLVQQDVARTWAGPVIAISDPIYNRADPRWSAAGGTPSNISLELARLAGSSREVESCLRVYRGGPSTPILLDGANATVAAVRKAFESHPRVLHFATHVVTAPETDRAGRIALTLTPKGEFELLSPAAVAADEVRAEVVVMSGCASGAGKVLPGEGLLGLTRAWLRAGVRNVAATLWPMTDHSSGVVEAFYRHLGTPGLAPHTALRRAQLEMIHSGGWKAAPSHWAAYFLIARR